jgi:RyR domain
LDPYHPQPIDTSAADLTPLQPLLETLARNAHEIWARERMKAGWSWGPARNDERKQHPSLIPYENLPESEKTYDRAMVSETLKSVLALGYRIIPD